MPTQKYQQLLRGHTIYERVTPPTSFENHTTVLEGTRKWFKDTDPSLPNVGAGSMRSNRDVLCELVRNVGAATLLPKRLVKYAAGYVGRRVDGYTCVNYNTGEIAAGVIDEHLTNGCPVNDMCWITVSGPTLIKTSLGADGTNVFSEGTKLVALTAATSGATTSGRVQPYEETSSVTVAQQQLLNILGVALSAKTTANTNVDMLVDMRLLKRE